MSDISIDRQLMINLECEYGIYDKFYNKNNILNESNVKRIKWKLDDCKHLVEKTFIELFEIVSFFDKKNLHNQIKLYDECHNRLLEYSLNIPGKSTIEYSDFKNKCIASVIYFLGINGQEHMVNKYSMLIK